MIEEKHEIGHCLQVIALQGWPLVQTPLDKYVLYGNRFYFVVAAMNACIMAEVLKVLKKASLQVFGYSIRNR